MSAPDSCCPRCQQENPPPGNFCSRCGGPLDAAVGTGPSYPQWLAENEELRRSLGTAVEQQTATAEILRVISSSPADVQPVFDAIVRSAVRLCDGLYGFVGRFDGEQIHIAAHHNYTPDALRVMQEMYPMRPSRQQMSGRVILTHSVVQIEDLLEDHEYAQRLARAGGWRASLGVPLLRDGNAIGMIAVMRGQPGPFSETQVRLLQTFADQAVIAIENLRLFTETKEALDQQTATADILRVISRSPTDTQPVFDAIAESAARLCSANDAQVLRVEGEILRLVAAYGATSMPSVRQLTRGHLVGRSVLDRRTIHVRDLAQALAEYPETTAARYGVQSALAVPLLRDGAALGVIRISRTEIQPFTDKQIALLQTFADQAVIAIENVRLFKELETRNAALSESLDQQTATSEVLKVISRSQTDVQPVFDAVVQSAVRLCGALNGFIWRVEDGLRRQVSYAGAMSQEWEAIARGTQAEPPTRETVSGWVQIEREVLHVLDLEQEDRFPRSRQIARAMGYRSLLAVPLLRNHDPVGAIVLHKAEPFDDGQIQLLRTFADQAVIAIENVRLFHELEAANRELSAASQHKSEFLANMSHELRTPLNAIIGFSEVLSEKMFGELNEKQEEYSKDIHASGQHLLSLINDILDLSKIEAGRMELELTDFDLPQAIDNALTLVRERAGRREIALAHTMDERLGEIRGDERKVKQVLLNLVSNALKFTPEGGRVEVRAGMVDGVAEISVTDTGVGIAPEDQGAIFEEFRQVGTADKKAEGTGLGLTLCRKFVELHGGKIWVKSEPGAGSTFTFTIPVRHGE